MNVETEKDYLQKMSDGMGDDTAIGTEKVTQ